MSIRDVEHTPYYSQEEDGEGLSPSPEVEMQVWCVRNRLTRETQERLLKEGFSSLYLLRLLKEDDDISTLMKGLPMAQKLALKDALKRLCKRPAVNLPKDSNEAKDEPQPLWLSCGWWLSIGLFRRNHGTDWKHNGSVLIVPSFKAGEYRCTTLGLNDSSSLYFFFFINKLVLYGFINVKCFPSMTSMVKAVGENIKLLYDMMILWIHWYYWLSYIKSLFDNFQLNTSWEEWTLWEFHQHWSAHHFECHYWLLFFIFIHTI